MSKLHPTLLALSLALALAALPAAAQQITTSQGVRSLPRTQGMTTEPQLRQALLASEQILDELLRDIEGYERSRSSASEDATALAAKVERANADYERAKTEFEKIDQQYRSDLAAFQQRQVALDAQVRDQRAQFQALDAIPSAQRNYDDVVRIDKWAAQIGTERQALEADRGRLLADHDHVETERANLAKQRTDAESKLKASREGIVGQFGSVDEKRKLAYRQLRISVNHIETLRVQYAKVAGHNAAGSRLLETSSRKLAAWEQAPATSR